MDLTVEERGQSPEALSDTVRVDLEPGEEKKIVHYFARPWLGRDVRNFLMLKSKFNEAELSWKITGTTTR
jgi:hypothetical protein